jgi:hypothetical protein
LVAILSAIVAIVPMPVVAIAGIVTTSAGIGCKPVTFSRHEYSLSLTEKPR